MDWQPPAHSRIVEQVLKTWVYDGGADLRHQFALSGEPPSKRVAEIAAARAGTSASDIAAVNRSLRELRKEYLDYWNSTKHSSGTGRPVDVLVVPVAPFTAPREGRYDYYGYTMFANGLDLPSIVVPITTADRQVDRPDASYRPVSELDRKIQSDCEFSLFWYLFFQHIPAPFYDDGTLLIVARRCRAVPRHTSLPSDHWSEVSRREAFGHR